MADLRTTASDAGRLAALSGDRAQSRLPASIAVPATALAAVCIAALLLPGRTVLTAYLNDVFIFLDGAWRVVEGQAPSRDFHTALGPLDFVLPALALAATGDFGLVMPGATALVLAALLPAVVRISDSRLRPVIALPFAAFLILIVAMPANLGESVSSLGFAMFYNRWGWVFLSLLLVLHLPPKPGRAAPAADAVAAAGLILAAVYTKATFGLAASAFLLVSAFDRQGRRWARPACVIVPAAALLVEFFWGGSLAHIRDLQEAARVSGGFSPDKAAGALMRHVADLVFLGLFVFGLLRIGAKPRDFFFLAFCAAAGFWILLQNAQPWGIITLHAGAAVAAERLLRSEDAFSRRGPFGRGAPLLLAAMLLPTILHAAATLGLHAAMARSDRFTPLPLPRFAQVGTVVLGRAGDPAFADLYLRSVADGAVLLSSVVPPPQRVTVLDFSNPFSAGLGLAPPRGDHAWLHWNRNLDAVHHPAPETLLGGAAFVMEPKWGINPEPLRALYGERLRLDFVPVRETEFWILHRRLPDAESER